MLFSYTCYTTMRMDDPLKLGTSCVDTESSRYYKYRRILFSRVWRGISAARCHEYCFITALVGATVTIAFNIRESWNQIKVINREDRHA